MRNPVRGWRSLRQSRVPSAGSAVAHAVPFPGVWTARPQEPLRLSLGLVALAFYLWIIHSYKLPAGDIAVLSLGVGVLIRGGTLRVPAPLMVFAALILWSAVGLGVTSSTDITMNALMSLGKLWILTFCVFNIIRNPAELRFLTIVWLAVFALYPIRGALFNYFICQCSPFGRVAWNFVFSNPNDLAALCLIPLGAAAGLAAVERYKLWRYCAFIGVAVLALTVMLTQSRGAMIGMGIAAILLPLTSRRRTRDLVLLVVVVGSAALVAPKGVWERLAGLSNASVEKGMQGVDPEGSAEARWLVWSIAGEAIREYPVTGVGLGMMPDRNRWVALRRGLDWSVRGERDTHSTYLRLAAETGIPGLIIYLVMWGTVIAKLRRAKNMIRNVRPTDAQFLIFIELSVWAFLVASVFGSYGVLSSTYVMLAFVWLSADILAKERWYVPASVSFPALVPSPSRRRGQARA